MLPVDFRNFRVISEICKIESTKYRCVLFLFLWFSPFPHVSSFLSLRTGAKKKCISKPPQHPRSRRVGFSAVVLLLLAAKESSLRIQRAMSQRLQHAIIYDKLALLAFAGRRRDTIAERSKRVDRCPADARSESAFVLPFYTGDQPSCIAQQKIMLAPLKGCTKDERFPALAFWSLGFVTWDCILIEKWPNYRTAGNWIPNRQTGRYDGVRQR